MMDVKAEELLYKLQTYITNRQQGNINGQAAVQALLDGKNVFVIYGDEPYYRTQIVKYLQEYIFDGIEEQDREMTVFEKDINPKEIEATVNSYPFFGGKSYVVLQDEKLLKSPPATEGEAAKERRKKKLDALAGIVSDVPEYCTLLVTSTGIDKRTKFYKTMQKLPNAIFCECEGINTRDIGGWLQRQATLRGAKLDIDAMGAIMEYLAPIDKAPLQLLSQEFDKLAVYKAGQAEWHREDVETIFSALPEAGNFALSNAFSDGKLKECLELLAGERKRKTNILPICASLQYKLRQMLQVKELLRQGFSVNALAAEMGLKSPYIAKKTAGQVRRFDERKLRQALLDMNQLNMDLRKGGRGYERLEEILVVLLG